MAPSGGALTSCWEAPVGGGQVARNRVGAVGGGKGRVNFLYSPVLIEVMTALEDISPTATLSQVTAGQPGR
jgi:hypothetical protein